MLETIIVPADDTVRPIGKQQARAHATRKVTRQINETEAQIDRAGIELFKLGIAMLEARSEAGLSATFGDTPVKTAIEAIGQWSASRRSTISAHRELLVIAGKLGTREIAFGDGGDRPEDDVVAPSGTLSDIAAAAA